MSKIKVLKKIKSGKGLIGGCEGVIPEIISLYTLRSFRQPLKTKKL